jgi:hypothetical protein
MPLDYDLLPENVGFFNAPVQKSRIDGDSLPPARAQALVWPRGMGFARIAALPFA